MGMEKGWKRRTVLFLVSQCITLFGSTLVQFAMVWYVTRATSSGAWVSALSICSFLPQTLLSPLCGVLADRYDKKTLIVLADAAIAVTTLLLVLCLPRIGEGNALLYALLAVSALRSVGAGVQVPAVNAMIPQLVPEAQLMRFNGVNATMQSAVQFAAPAAAGAVLTLGTLSQTMLIDVATAAAGIGVLLAAGVPAGRACAPTGEETGGSAALSMGGEIRAGFRYTFGDAFLKRLMLLYGVFIFLSVPAGFLATLFVSRTYGDGYLYMTAVELVGFLGMTAGGLLIGIWGGFQNRVRTLLTGLCAFGALAVGMGAIRNFIAYLALMLLYGVALTMVQTAVTTLVQEKTDAAMQGRVFGYVGAIYGGCMPLGMAIFGPLADAMPMRPLMLLSGVALLALAAVYAALRGFVQAGEGEKA